MMDLASNPLLNDTVPKPKMNTKMIRCVMHIIHAGSPTHQSYKKPPANKNKLVNIIQNSRLILTGRFLYMSPLLHIDNLFYSLPFVDATSFIHLLT